MVAQQEGVLSWGAQSSIIGEVDFLEALFKALETQVEVAACIRPDQLLLTTACEGWSVRDVMNHSVGVTLKFAQFASGATDRPVTPHRDVLGLDHAGALRNCAGAARAAWVGADMTRVCELPFGRFTADLTAGINLFDVLAHTWDMAGPAKVPFEIGAPVWAAGLEAARAVVGPRRDPAHYGEEVAAGPTASTKVRFLAFLGRAELPNGAGGACLGH